MVVGREYHAKNNSLILFLKIGDISDRIITCEIVELLVYLNKNIQISLAKYTGESQQHGQG
jgi:hypothetical protein